MKNIIIKEFRRYLRNPFMVVTLILFPIIMIYILGNLVENVQTADETIGKIQVAYTAEQIDFITPSINDQVQFLSVTSKEGPTLLHDNQVDGYFMVGPDGITLYEGSSVLKNSVVKGIVNSYLLQESVYESITKNNSTSLLTITMRAKDYTAKKELSANMTMFDYYAISMTIMTGVFSCLTASMIYTEERKNKTMNRLITSPINKGKVFCAQCLGQIPFAMIQVGATLFVSAVFFDANYATSFVGKLILFSLLMMTSVVFSVVGIVISLIFKKTMAIALFLISWLMLFFSGCFAKPMTLEPICDFLPPYILRQAAFELNVFNHKTPAIRALIVELLFVIVLIAIGGWIFSKKQEERV